MNNQNISASPQDPHWLLSNPDLLPRLGAAHRAPAGARTSARPGLPSAHLSGYEQILAARAALRAEVGRAAAAERRAFAAPSPAPARGARRPAAPRRRLRLGLVASGLVAAPACAVLAGLAWIEAAPPPPAARIAVPAAAPTSGAPPLAVAHQDVPASAAEIHREALYAAASREEDTALDTVPVTGIVPDAAAIVAPASAGAQESLAELPASFAAGDEHFTDDAVGALAANPAAAEDAPLPASVELPMDAHPVADASLSASVGQPSSADPGADATPVKFDEAAVAAAAPLPLPRPEHQLMALAPPPFAQGERVPAKTRNPLPPRPVRTLDNDAPPVEARCRSIIMKAQLGEEANHVDRTFLRTACRARR